MATLKEEFELLKAKIMAGKGNEIVHVVYHEAEKKRKRDNPQKSTRMILDCRTPEAWTEMQMEKERYFSIAVDPHIAIMFMGRALAQVTDDTLRQWLTDGHQNDGDQPGPGPEKARLPEWLL